MAFSAILLLAWLLWWLWQRSEREAEAPIIELKAEAPPPATEPPVAEAKIEAETTPEPLPPMEPDDLKRIEGIGPKISSVLQAAGIATFAHLAATEVTRIEQILEEESPRLRTLADPTTWPEQAKLAAAGDWQGLEALKSELKGGRRE
jgi:predicted flap endonuclease-1-like 5' DNA nuclease